MRHLGFPVGERRDAVPDELRDMGFEMRTAGHYPGGSRAIVDSEDTLNANLNIKPGPRFLGYPS